MNFKYTFFVFIIILCILLSAMCVCASDEQMDMVNTEDNYQSDMKLNSDLKSVGSCDENQHIIANDNYNFTDLNDEISKIESGDTFTLKNDYKYNSNDSNFKDGIIINKDNIVIDGAGFTIDGAGQARIFDILSNNVTLKNINFVNAYSSQNGGAISALGNINILNSVFYNNTANNSGGAVFIKNAFSNSKINSTFLNNSAFNGGAIYFNGTITNTSINGLFKGNIANRAGGAIFIRGISTYNSFNCEFNNNSANLASGGAIFFYNLAENNEFECIFTYNNALYGGALFFYSKANNNKFNTNFSYNIAQSCGGGIFFYSTTNNNNFTGYFISNYALGKIDDVNGNGGGITFKNNSTNCIFFCDFIDNIGVKNGGGVNYRQTPKNITFNSNFINNGAGVGGGVNFFESFENVVFNGQFLNNYAVYGGAMAIGYGVIENVSFIKNDAEIGGAIYINKNGTVLKSVFVKNNASDGGAIFSGGNLTVADCGFENNTADLGTNHIGLNANATVKLINESSLLPKAYVCNITYGENVIIALNVSEDNYKLFNNTVISCGVNGKIYSADIKNGSAEIIIPNLDVGVYDLNLSYGGNQCVANSQVKFNVSKQNALITAADKAYIINYGGKYSITLKDALGNVLVGNTVMFILNSKSISGVTDDKGIATVTLTANLLKTIKSGIRKFVIKFSDLNYNEVSKTVKITINKEKTKIIAKNEKFKKSKRVKKYSISLKNSNKKPLSKLKVSLKINGKTYMAKTNSKGKATFKITKLNKKAKIAGVVKFEGNSYYAAVSKKVKITIK